MDFVKRLLVVDFEKRMDVDEAINHIWITRKGLSVKRRMCPIVLERLKSFKKPHKFKKEMMILLLNAVKEEDIRQIKETFLAIDKMHTGSVSIEDLVKGIVEAGYARSADEIRTLVSRFGEDPKKRINYTDFITAALDVKKHITTEQLHEVFQRLDPKRTGRIDMHSLSQVFRRSGRAFSNAAISKMMS